MSREHRLVCDRHGRTRCGPESTMHQTFGISCKSNRLLLYISDSPRSVYLPCAFSYIQSFRPSRFLRKSAPGLDYSLSNLPCDLDGVELHPNSKYGALLTVLRLWIRAYHGAEVVILHLLLVLGDELAPSFLALFALHIILIQRGRRIEFWEILLEVLVDFVVDLGESQLGTGHFLEDLPVCFHVLDNCAPLSDTLRIMRHASYL